MTTINTNYLLNNLAITNQNSITSSSSAASKNSIARKKIPCAFHKVNCPGVTNILFAPFEFIDNVIGTLVASRIQDNEGMLLNGLRIASTPASFISSFLQLGRYLVQLGIFCQIFSSTVLSSFGSIPKIVTGLGFVICAIEGIIEALGIKRTVQFYSSTYPADLESLKAAIKNQDKQKIALYLNRLISTLPDTLKQGLKEKELTPETLRKLEENVYLRQLEKLNNEFFQISPEKAKNIACMVQKKFSRLSAEDKERKIEFYTDMERIKNRSYLIRRVQSKLAKEIEKTLPQAIADLQSTDLEKRKSSIEKTSKLFEQVKTQTYKNLLVHALGLFALLISVAGLTAGLMGAPLIVLIPLIAFGMGTAIFRNILGKGFIEAKGWNFDVKRCLPNFFYITYKKLTEKKVVQLPPLNSIPMLYLDLSKLKQPAARKGIDYTLFRA